MRNEDAQAGFHSSRPNTAVAHGRERGDPEFPSERRSRAMVLGGLRARGAGLAGVRKEIAVRQRPCSPPHRPRPSYAIRLISARHVIPDGRGATDRESISHISLRRRLWIPGQTFGLPGMTTRRSDQGISHHWLNLICRVRAGAAGARSCNCYEWKFRKITNSKHGSGRHERKASLQLGRLATGALSGWSRDAGERGVDRAGRCSPPPRSSSSQCSARPTRRGRLASPPSRPFPGRLRARSSATAGRSPSRAAGRSPAVRTALTPSPARSPRSPIESGERSAGPPAPAARWAARGFRTPPQSRLCPMSAKSVAGRAAAPFSAGAGGAGVLNAGRITTVQRRQNQWRNRRLRALGRCGRRRGFELRHDQDTVQQRRDQWRKGRRRLHDRRRRNHGQHAVQQRRDPRWKRRRRRGG